MVSDSLPEEVLSLDCFRPNMHWLVASPFTRTTISHLRFDSNLIMVEEEEASPNMVLREFYKVPHTSAMEQRRLGVWSKEGGLRLTSFSTWERRADLGGVVLSFVTTMIMPMFLRFLPSPTEAAAPKSGSGRPKPIGLVPDAVTAMEVSDTLQLHL